MRFLKSLLLVAILAGLIVGGVRVFNAQFRDNTPPAPDKPAPQITAAEMEALRQNLATTISASPSTSVGLSAVDLTTNKRLDAGLSDTEFKAASTTKILSVAAYMHQVEQGATTLDKLIQGSTAQSLIQRMLNQSDNNAWAALDAYLTSNGIATYAQSIGLDNFNRSQNLLTPHDMATLLVKLDKAQLMTIAHRDLLYSYMQNTNNEDLIPAGLPSGASVYHKFGLYEGELHDTAVVRYHERRYILVIYTNNDTDDLADYTARTELIHKLTNQVLTGLDQAAAS